MADLIERYKITANLPSVLMNYCNRFNGKQLESITEMIYELENSIESADVQPVCRGTWLHFNNDSNFIFCSECNHEAYWDTDYGQQLFDYCPYCGARMMKED